MLKEISEQPRAVRDTTLGRVGQETGRIFLDEMEIAPAEFARFRQVRIIACGTSWHAALAGKFMIERLARVPVEVDYGSEFRYRDPIIGEDNPDRRDLPVRARPPTRSRPSAKPSRRGRRRSPSATWSDR
jgi:glucosamine--fructose-6-phosphate aminotransferase (isomerizing)